MNAGNSAHSAFSAVKGFARRTWRHSGGWCWPQTPGATSSHYGSEAFADLDLAAGGRRVVRAVRGGCVYAGLPEFWRREEEAFSGFGSKIAVVDLDGVIFSPKQVVPQLKKFADDDSVKAIIIHVNSPGGGVAASEEIYREVKRIRDEKKKRIVASIETVGASGAYYVASATNKIYADKGSVVGSIGVIAEWVNYGELLKWAKRTRLP